MLIMKQRRETLLTVAVIFAATGCLFAGCMPSHSNAQNNLMWLLNSEEGRTITAEQLVAKKDHITLWDRMRGVGIVIDFPLTETNTLPREAVVYTAPDTSSRMTFRLADSDGNPQTVGKVLIEPHENHWGLPDDRHLPEETYYVESRGNGVYTLYSYETESTDSTTMAPSDSLQTAASLTKKWEPRVLFVYPGADSIVVSRGSKETLHTFFAEKSL